MNCPFCDKRIAGITGLQEIRSFMRHLNAKNGCKKNPKRESFVTQEGVRWFAVTPTDMQEALEIRANSNQ